MKYKKEIDPVCGIVIHLLASTEEELLAWGVKRYIEIDRESFENADAVVFAAINKGGQPLVWFRTDADTQCLSITTIAHEVFHLWHFMKARMMGSKMLSLDVSNAEYDAYHFENLFSMIADFAFNAYDQQVSFPKRLKNGKRCIIPAIRDEKEVKVNE